MTFYNTRQVARLLDVSIARLTRAIWLGNVDAPPKTPSGAYLWSPKDIERASWQLLGREYKPPTAAVQQGAKSLSRPSGQGEEVLARDRYLADQQRHEVRS